jgi:hypothetical protein
VGILLDVMTKGDFGSEDTVYLDMFIARNLPKFPQFIILPGKILDQVLVRLCDYPSDELAEDCQLSVEYLLSYYHPSDIESLTSVFRRAGFYRVLKSVYRAGKQYAQLVQTHFEDPNDRSTIFDCIGDCLRPGSDLTSKQIREVHSVLVKNAQDLVGIDTSRAATSIATYAPQLLRPIFDALDQGSYLQFMFLKNVLDPASTVARLQLLEDEEFHHEFEENYVRLMCAYEPSRVADYIGVLKSGDLRLNEVLPAMESSGAIDAAVLLLARDGLVNDAMKRLKSHMLALQGGLIGLIEAATESPDANNTTEAIDGLLDDIQKYSKVGIWLCQGQTLAAKQKQHKKSPASKKLVNEDPEANLSTDEHLWLELVDAIVNATKNVSAAATVSAPESSDSITSKITTRLRMAVQECFTALLNSTARPAQSSLSSVTIPLPSAQPHPSFLLILRAFLARAASSSPSLSDLRAVLAEIFQAYAFEERILDLAHQFLDKDLFVHVEDAWASRQIGWRPRGNVCEECGRRIWGPGVGSAIWESWESKMEKSDSRKLERRRSGLPGSEGDAANLSNRDRGKGKAIGIEEPETEETAEEDGAPHDGDLDASQAEGKVDPALQPLVVFACRHVWHRDCLKAAMGRAGLDAEQKGFECPAKH